MSLWPFGQGQLDNFQPKGVCLVWNLKYKRETPEYVFTSESPLVTARHVHCMYKDIYDSYLDQTMLFRFSMFHPNLIIGGAYSGQIMLWDNRCRFFANAFQSFAKGQTNEARFSDRGSLQLLTHYPSTVPRFQMINRQDFLGGGGGQLKQLGHSLNRWKALLLEP